MVAPSPELRLDPLRRLFERTFGSPPARITPVASDGSRRRMVRLARPDGGTVVGVLGPDPDENRAFLSFSRTFRALGLRVPEVHGADEAARCYLVEDLGDTTLFRALTEARAREPGPFPASMLPAYRRVLEVLPRFQVEGGRAIDFAAAHPRAAFDRPSMRWDLDYFKYHFLKLADIPFHEARLEDDFERLVAFLLESDGRHFLYRDFQSRNVMLRENASGGREPWFIDYQGGRRGALPYDVASLLFDAKAEIPPTVREDLLEGYLDALAAFRSIDRERFREEYRGFVLIRILQAMGAYGYRGFYERKPHFLQSVPPAVRNVEHILHSGPLPVEMPELVAVFERICASESLAQLPHRGAAPEEAGLTVRVGSFSYRSGVPGDPSGHGGGFVFDCRALPNPGLDPRHASFTGRDAEVASRLEAEAGVEEFFGHARSLVETQVRAYLAKGFTSLSVHFGCTGGQHRSVYLAERLARRIEEEFPGVHVRLDHAERSRWPEPIRG